MPAQPSDFAQPQNSTLVDMAGGVAIACAGAPRVAFVLLGGMQVPRIQRVGNMLPIASMQFVSLDTDKFAADVELLQRECEKISARRMPAKLSLPALAATTADHE